jgi:hypothetical protein
VKPETPPKGSLADAIDTAAVRAGVDDFEAMDPAAQQAELDRLGFDPDRMKARLDGLLKARPAGKVVDLAAKRAERATRWVPFSAAAAAALLLGGASSWKAATTMPPRTVDYPTQVQGPPTHAVARGFLERALRRCKQGYFEECKDDLASAHAIDPTTDNEPDAIAARKALDDEGKRDKTPDPSHFPNAKHGPAPGERPLQPLR